MNFDIHLIPKWRPRHGNEAIGARCCEITIDLYYAEGVFFFKIQLFFRQEII